MHAFLEKLSDRQRKIYETLPNDILQEIANSKAPTPPAVDVPGDDEEMKEPVPPATAPAGSGKRPLPLPRPRSADAMSSLHAANSHRSHTVGAAAFSRTALLGRSESAAAMQRARAQADRSEVTAARGDGDLLPTVKRPRRDIEYASSGLRFCTDPERALR